MTRPRPDLDPGDRVLVVAHRWVAAPGGPMWLPHGGYRWRVVDRLVWDSWRGSWQIMSEPTEPHHPAREDVREVVAVLRPGGERRPAPVAPAAPVQLDLFEVEAQLVMDHR